MLGFDSIPHDSIRAMGGPNNSHGADTDPIEYKRLLNLFSQTRECKASQGHAEAHDAGTMLAIGLGFCCVPIPLCTAIGLVLVFCSVPLFLTGAYHSAANLNGVDRVKDVFKSLARAALGSVFFLELPVVLALQFAILSKQIKSQAVKDFVEFTEQHRFYAAYEERLKFFVEQSKELHCEKFDGHAAAWAKAAARGSFTPRDLTMVS